jgi:hypothetical protein
MMTDIIAPTRGSPAAPQIRTDFAAIMDTALAPFTFSDQWCRSDAAREAAKFIDTDKDGELVALRDDADWMASRTRAVEIQRQLPPPAEIEAARKAVDQAVNIKPASGEYQLLTSKMLDVLGIKGGDNTDAYVEAMAWTLVEAWPNNADRDDTPKWIPFPAFAKAVKRVLADRDAWNHFGGTKRPPIPDIVEYCRDYRRELVWLRDSITALAYTQRQLGLIIQTVNSYEEDGWGDDEPSKH